MNKILSFIKNNNILLYILLLFFLISMREVEVIKIVEKPVIEKVIIHPFEYYSVIKEDIGIFPNKEDFNFIVEESIKKEVDYVLVLAMVIIESKFKEYAINYNTDNSIDYGYFQLNSKWHIQYKNNTKEHIIYGINFFKWCLDKDFGNVKSALSRYNSGRPNSIIGLKYAEKILACKEILVRGTDETKTDN